MSEVVTTEARELTLLAGDINREHEACRAAGEAFAMHAYRCGELLLEVKTRVAHGEWGAWLAANFAASERTAQLYMRTARSGDPQRVADLSLRGALREIAGPADADVVVSFSVRLAGDVVRTLMGVSADGLPRLEELFRLLIDWQAAKDASEDAFARVLDGDDLRALADMWKGVYPEEHHLAGVAFSRVQDLHYELFPTTGERERFDRAMKRLGGLAAQRVDELTAAGAVV
jgi:hypothetical protein